MPKKEKKFIRASDKTLIQVSKETSLRLQKLVGQWGQTYNDVIKELLDEREKK